MSKKRKIASAVLLILTLALCVLIFYLSAQTADESSLQSGGLIDFIAKIFGVEFTDFVIRKFAHACEFALLGFLSALCVSVYTLNLKKLYISVVFSIIYALSDEIHQIFVAGRACQFRDICIDSAGVLTGTAVAAVIIYLYLKKRNKTVDK